MKALVIRVSIGPILRTPETRVRGGSLAIITCLLEKLHSRPSPLKQEVASKLCVFWSFGKPRTSFHMTGTSSLPLR
jgi:hypothetical protein